MEPEGAMQASEREKQPSILPSYDRYMNHHSDHNNPGEQQCHVYFGSSQQFSNWT